LWRRDRGRRNWTNWTNRSNWTDRCCLYGDGTYGKNGSNRTRRITGERINMVSISSDSTGGNEW
jgi:hypothetical protein